MEIILYVICGIALLISILLSARSGKTLKNLVISSALGFVTLLLLVFFGNRIGLSVNLNIVTALLSLSGGIPGAIFAGLIGMFI